MCLLLSIVGWFSDFETRKEEHVQQNPIKNQAKNRSHPFVLSSNRISSWTISPFRNRNLCNPTVNVWKVVIIEGEIFLTGVSCPNEILSRHPPSDLRRQEVILRIDDHSYYQSPPSHSDCRSSISLLADQSFRPLSSTRFDSSINYLTTPHREVTFIKLMTGEI